MAMIAPSMSKVVAPGKDDSAKSEVNGAVRSVTYTVSRIGTSYLKPTDYSKLGQGDHTQIGINEWYIPRNVNYNDTIVHSSYPCVIAYNGYSDFLANQAKYKYLTASWTIHMFYRLQVDAENIAGLATGAGDDPWIVPILLSGGLAQDGGWVNMSLYQTYLTDQEFEDVQDGLHYANTYYGVDSANFSSYYHALASDGWFAEIQGTWDFSRRAAHKFMGLPATGDLRTEYDTASNASRTKNGQNIAWAWRAQWIADGDAGNPLDIYAAYDYSLYTGNGPVFIWLKLDPSSTADKLVLRFWSLSWGAEYLLGRYLEQVGIYKNWETSAEDWYLNGTFCPINGDIHEIKTSTYHMTAWKDPQAYNNPTWMLAPQHYDYTAEHLGDYWESQFDPYYWTYYADSYRPTIMCWAPGQVNYGNAVHYWATPRDWNLTADETLVVKLPTDTSWGIEPYWSGNYTVPGNAALEMQANGVSGELVLGHGYPASLYSPAYYNGATKTITIPGGSSWAPNPNPGYPSILETGSPLFYLDISPVSHYNLSIVEPGPYLAGQTYTLRVTPWDLSNNPVRCNQTVELPAVAGVTYGTTSHTFAWGEASWDTTVVFANPNTDYTLTSQDQYFYLDISDVFTIHVGNLIPEFPTLLIPVIGAVAMFVVFGKRKAKK